MGFIVGAAISSSSSSSLFSYTVAIYGGGACGAAYTGASTTGVVALRGAFIFNGAFIRGRLSKVVFIIGAAGVGVGDDSSSGGASVSSSLVTSSAGLAGLVMAG